jgi:phage-related protein
VPWDMGSALRSMAGNIRARSRGRAKGPGIFEIVEDHAGDTYRALYTVRFADAIYVLHAFQKKSPSGRRTAQTDVALVRERLKRAREYYEARTKKQSA